MSWDKYDKFLYLSHPSNNFILIRMRINFILI